jgi:rhodanese-related sulfurtransferase
MLDARPPGTSYAVACRAHAEAVRQLHESSGRNPMIGNIVRLSAVAIAVLAMAAGGAAAQDISVHQATLAEANQKTPEMSTEQLRRILSDGSAIVVDTRSRAEFDAGHIPSARNLDAPPAGHVAAVERLVGGNKNAALVLYCNGPYCQASRRLAEQLATAGFTNVRRYQLGIPIWRALGGPTEIELGGIARIYKADQTAVFIDGRSAEAFAKGSLSGAHSVPADELAAGKLKTLPFPEDDFNRRIVLFGGNASEARKLADVMSKRPWHNVAYFAGSFDALAAALKDK